MGFIFILVMKLLHTSSSEEMLLRQLSITDIRAVKNL